MIIRAWTPQEHPRLFFGREDVENLRAKRKVDEVARAAWTRLEEDIEKAVDEKTKAIAKIMTIVLFNIKIPRFI